MEGGTSQALIAKLDAAMSSQLDEGIVRRLDNAIALTEREYPTTSPPPALKAKLLEATERARLIRGSLERRFEQLFGAASPSGCDDVEARLARIARDESLPVGVRDLAGARLVQEQNDDLTGADLLSTFEDRVEVLCRGVARGDALWAGAGRRATTGARHANRPNRYRPRDPRPGHCRACTADPASARKVSCT